MEVRVAAGGWKPVRVNHLLWENEVKHRQHMLARAAVLVIEGSVAGYAALALPAAMAADAEAVAPAQRVEITGSAIRRVESEGALPITVISRDAIDKTGAVSVTELIQKLPAMTGGNFQQSSSSVNGNGNGDRKSVV